MSEKTIIRNGPDDMKGLKFCFAPQNFGVSMVMQAKLNLGKCGDRFHGLFLGWMVGAVNICYNYY